MRPKIVPNKVIYFRGIKSKDIVKSDQFLTYIEKLALKDVKARSKHKKPMSYFAKHKPYSRKRPPKLSLAIAHSHKGRVLRSWKVDTENYMLSIYNRSYLWNKYLGNESSSYVDGGTTRMYGRLKLLEKTKTYVLKEFKEAMKQ